MPFIGNQPAEKYSAFTKQDFSTSATTSYTLSQAVANENEIALFINFVRQEPTTAYTASGTSLTLTSATSGSDDMYCVYLGKAVQTVNPPNSSVGNSQLDVSAINSQTAETSIAGGDEVLIYDTSASALRKMTRTNFVSGVGGTNTPAFYVYPTSNQSIANTTDVTIAFDTEVYDTASAFASNTFTVPSGQGGKYCIFFSISRNNFSCSRFTIKLDVAGTEKAIAENASGRNYDSAGLTTVLPLNAGDAVFLKVYQDSGSTQTLIGNQKRSFFGGYKIIE